MLINLPGLKTLDILIMFIGCPRHYMGLSKPQELGMSTFGTSSFPCVELVLLIPIAEKHVCECKEEQGPSEVIDI